MTAGKTFRILSLYDDSAIGGSREALLRRSGYEVASARGDACPDERLAGPFDLAVLCQFLDEERMMRLIEILRELNPDIRVILVNRYLPARNPDADALYSIGEGPERFLRLVASVLGSRP